MSGEPFFVPFVGERVRQIDWLLRPRGYRDGEIVAVGEAATGTKHTWVYVKFDHVPVVLRCSTSQLIPFARQTLEPKEMDQGIGAQRVDDTSGGPTSPVSRDEGGE